MNIFQVKICWLAYVVAAISLCACNAASGPPKSKYDAEELGYVTQFANVGLSDRCKALIANAYDQDKYRGLNDERGLAGAQTAYGAHMDALRAIAKGHIRRLEIALPPDSLRELHDARLRFLAFALAAADSSTSTEAQQFFEQCKSYHEVSDRIIRSIAARTESYPTQGTLKLSYQPPFIPSLTFHHDGSFTVKSNISTPIGDFSLGYTNTTGAKLLIIRSEGRERYFSLARPFELYLPATHGINVSGDGNTTLTIEVVQR